MVCGEGFSHFAKNFKALMAASFLNAIFEF